MSIYSEEERKTHLRDRLSVGTHHFLQSLRFLEQLGHGTCILGNVTLAFLRVLFDKSYIIGIIAEEIQSVLGMPSAGDLAGGSPSQALQDDRRN